MPENEMGKKLHHNTNYERNYELIMRFPVKGGIERITIVMSEVNNQDIQQDLQD